MRKPKVKTEVSPEEETTIRKTDGILKLLLRKSKKPQSSKGKERPGGGLRGGAQLKFGATSLRMD